MKFKNLFGFGKLTTLGFTQEDAQGHDTSGSISVCHPHVTCEQLSRASDCHVRAIVICERLPRESNCHVRAIAACKGLLHVSYCQVRAIAMCEQLTCTSNCQVRAIVKCERLPRDHMMTLGVTRADSRLDVLQVPEKCT